MNKYRILVLTPRFPYPVVGGDRLRIYEVCRELAKSHELTLLSLCESEEEMEYTVPADGVFSTVERVLLPKWRSIVNVLCSVPSKSPLQVAYYSSGPYRRRVNELLKVHDLCLPHLIRTGDYVRGAGVPTLLEMTDAISMNYQRFQKIGTVRGFKSLVYRFEASRLLRYERAILNDFDALTLVSDVDRQFLLDGQASDRLLVCSNGVNLSHLPFKKRVDSAPVAVFIGNMNSIQNLDACFYFVEEILPHVRKKIPFTFRVIGRITERDAARLRAFDGVEVLSNVDSVAEAASDARVGIAPVRLGAGVQNKVLEYMALGLPVVTSPVALEGLSARPNLDLMVANTVGEYISHLQELWASPARREELAQNGLAYVKENHSWERRLAPLVGAVNDLLATRPAKIAFAA